MKRTTSALYIIIAITLLVSFVAAWNNSKLMAAVQRLRKSEIKSIQRSISMHRSSNTRSFREDRLSTNTAEVAFDETGESESLGIDLIGIMSLAVRNRKCD